MLERTSKKQTNKNIEKRVSKMNREREWGDGRMGRGADMILNYIITNCRLNFTKETEYKFTLWLQIRWQGSTEMSPVSVTEVSQVLIVQAIIRLPTVYLQCQTGAKPGLLPPQDYLVPAAVAQPYSDSLPALKCGFLTHYSLDMFLCRRTKVHENGQALLPLKKAS